MIVVADTSPINYLILIEEIDILAKMYGTVVIPRSVHDELLRPSAPEVVRKWISQLPAWLEVRRPTSAPDPLLATLDPGERDAIVLAAELYADQLIVDDWQGRREARKRGIRVMGTLGVLRDNPPERSFATLRMTPPLHCHSEGRRLRSARRISLGNPPNGSNLHPCLLLPVSKRVNSTHKLDFDGLAFAPSFLPARDGLTTRKETNQDRELLVRGNRVRAVAALVLEDSQAQEAETEQQEARRLGRSNDRAG